MANGNGYKREKVSRYPAGKGLVKRSWQGGKGRPFKKGDPGGPGRPLGMPNLVSKDLRDFLVAVTQEPEYRQRIYKSLCEGTLPHQIEILIIEQVCGKATQRVQIAGHDGGPLRTGSAADLAESLAPFVPAARAAIARDEASAAREDDPEKPVDPT